MSPALTLLGKVSYRRADGSVVDASSVPTTKALDLLRLVAGSGEHTFSGERLIGLLWPTSDSAHGRMSLRTAVAQLRRGLDPGVVVRDGDLLRLGGIRTDVASLRDDAARAERLTAGADDDELLALVLDAEGVRTGELAVSSGSCEAVYALRDELLELSGQLLLAGAAAAHRLGRSRECLRLAQTADRQLGSESSARAVMLAWAQLGEVRRVVEVFEQLRSTLQVAYGVQPSSETRALYLQIVTAGDGLGLRQGEHHRDVVAALAATAVELVGSEAGSGVVWLLGEPGAGRGVVAREAVRLLRSTRADVADVVLVLPEVVGLDAAECDRLVAEARAHQTVLVVPVRRALPTRARRAPCEAVVEVGPLERDAFHDLVHHLLQGQPSADLEERLWMTSGGLAGHATRTVGALIQRDALRWLPGHVELTRVPQQRGDVRRSPDNWVGDATAG